MPVWLLLPTLHLPVYPLVSQKQQILKYTILFNMHVYGLKIYTYCVHVHVHVHGTTGSLAITIHGRRYVFKYFTYNITVFNQTRGFRTSPWLHLLYILLGRSLCLLLTCQKKDSNFAHFTSPIPDSVEVAAQQKWRTQAFLHRPITSQSLSFASLIRTFWISK